MVISPKKLLFLGGLPWLVNWWYSLPPSTDIFLLKLPKENLYNKHDLSDDKCSGEPYSHPTDPFHGAIPGNTAAWTNFFADAFYSAVLVIFSILWKNWNIWWECHWHHCNGIIFIAVIHSMNYDRWCFVPQLYMFCRMG